MESLAFSGSPNLDPGLEALTHYPLPETSRAKPAAAERQAREILALVNRFRRSPGPRFLCAPTCPSCQEPHFRKVVSALRAKEPVTFVLPAFPGKSPNLAKVLGTLPDMAETLALQFLDQLCGQIQEIYAPGARIVLCSDGRVFSDIVGMKESDVSAYQDVLDRMIEEHGLENLSTFNLDALCEGDDFGKMRRELMEEFGSSRELLREKVRKGSSQPELSEESEAHRMYCGLTRFLVEDSSFPGQTKSRTAIQKECKAKAYDVMLRSNAWSELIAQRFPEAVRLSIHPQVCGSKKLGLSLVGTDSWMTPWHGAAVKTSEGFVLLKRKQAEALGARLVFSGGRPSHFELPNGVRIANEL